MFFELRKVLVNEDMVDLESDQWIGLDNEEEIEDLGNISDTESDGAAGEEPNRYLELENDVGIIEHWVKDLKSNAIVDEKLNTALLCSHNSEISNNAKLMVVHSNGQLLDALTTIIVNPKNSLALVRACCRTLLNVVKLVPEVSAGWKEVKAVLDTVLSWNTENENFTYERPVSNSKDIQRLTGATVALLKDRLDASKAPEDVKATTLEIKDWLEKSGSDIDPDAAENFTTFIEYLL